MTVEPGSAVPETVNVPLGLAAADAVGATGAVASVYDFEVTGELFPAGSLSTTVTEPEGCGVADVAEYIPLAATGTLAVVPSGNVTVTVEPGSPVPATVSVPFGFAVIDAVGATGADVSA